LIIFINLCVLRLKQLILLDLYAGNEKEIKNELLYQDWHIYITMFNDNHDNDHDNDCTVKN